MSQDSAVGQVPVFGDEGQGFFSQERRGVRRRDRRDSGGGGAFSDILEALFGPDMILGGEPRELGSLEDRSPYSDEAMDALRDLLTGVGPQGPTGERAMMDVGQYGWDQFAAAAPQLYDMTMAPTSQFSQGQTALAERNASLGIEQAMNEMSGLGSLYSGATLDAGNRAAQDAYLQATNATNQFGAGLLNTLWGQNMPLGYQSGAGMSATGAGLYGQALGGLTGYGDPMLQDPGIGGMFSQYLAAMLPFLSLA